MGIVSFWRDNEQQTFMEFPYILYLNRTQVARFALFKSPTPLYVDLSCASLYAPETKNRTKTTLRTRADDGFEAIKPLLHYC